MFFHEAKQILRNFKKVFLRCICSDNYVQVLSPMHSNRAAIVFTTVLCHWRRHPHCLKSLHNVVLPTTITAIDNHGNRTK